VTALLSEQNLLDEQGRIPASFKEVLKKQSASAAGWSAVSQWLTCPEKSRLNALGIRRANGDREFNDEALSDLSFGSLVHYLRALRVKHGPESVEAALDQWRSEIPVKSFALARNLFRTYESIYPRSGDSFEYLGVEASIVTNVAGLQFTPINRTVRYDTVVRLRGVGGAPDEIFSFEAKTMARSGMGSIQPYMGQAMVQVALWNANEALVAAFGPMRGVLFDCYVKTATPTVDRMGPFYFGKVHTRLALKYLALPDNGGVSYQKDAEGKFPKLIHACWGRWRACEYINACHEEAYGDYAYSDGSVYDGR